MQIIKSATLVQNHVSKQTFLQFSSIMVIHSTILDFKTIEELAIEKKKKDLQAINKRRKNNLTTKHKHYKSKKNNVEEVI